MDMSFVTPVSALQTTFLRQNVTAHNIANVNTPGYSEQNVEQVEMITGGVRASAITRIPNDSIEISNVDLTKQMTDLIKNKDLTVADAKVIKVKDRMLGALLDIIG